MHDLRIAQIPGCCEGLWQQRESKYCRVSKGYAGVSGEEPAPIRVECPFAARAFETFNDTEIDRNYAVAYCGFSGSREELDKICLLKEKASLS